MKELWNSVNGWVWLGLLALAAAVLIFLWLVGRYVIKRWILWGKLTADDRHGRSKLRPRRPLWWLLGKRLDYDFLLELPDPDTGAAAYTLAVKVIPTLQKTTEYSIGNMDAWHAKTNYAAPTPLGYMKFDLGYRRCLSRPVEEVFRHAPAGAVRVYLFHPHPYALTMAHRGEEKRSHSRGITELGVPLWHAGVLCMDLASLRKLETADAQTRRAILIPPKE